MIVVRLRTTLAGLVLATISFSGTIDAASAAGKFGPVAPQVHRGGTFQALEAAPTGDGPAGEAECKRFENAINSWLDAQVEAVEALDEDGARTADRNATMLEDEATDAGCFIIY